MINKLYSLTTVFLLLAVFGGVVSRQLYIENKSLKAELVSVKSDPQLVAREEAKDLVKKLAALVVLPEGEDPVIATVTDKEKLKDQPAFARAENGDKLVIYANAKKAYLFDPKEGRVRDIVPVNIGEQGEVAGATKDAKAKPTAKVTPQPKADQPSAGTPTPTPGG
jgi:hypothetical protein